MKYQQGATLIVVMIILLVITVLGTIAVKSGILGLKIATNSQVSALLLESSDAALFNVENPNEVETQLSGRGMFAYLDLATNADDELVFCYRAKDSEFFSLAKASAISGASTSKMGITGYCTASDYSTGRSAVLTQVYLTRIKSNTAPLSTFAIGTSAGQSGLPVTSNSVGATVISVLPSFSGAASDKINGCFKRSKDAVAECFEDLNVPYNMQRADYTVGGSPTLKTS
ncbi:pilus assembly PilX family protein [Acinetobacter johnsonii]|jgi:Tfp pilus assembly protein PilX|uniref:pilus assembly PilX family protein n=1 Tax=Acinetobacter johnsonii TaxID=40214 RepID=UPI0019182C7F|nr:pilus assembly protein PilX [Acinetobacter johnsonii]QQT92152.1 pilus assembly protein PilX [Acinetobacter johnsonii]WQN47185.1 pilus assembly protein PilX [Acinetobacter johnsonii]WQN50371.1 pilus assembly protein PilX [Acinetobacter johnsonii]